MAYRYMIHAFCDECSVPHPTGIAVRLDELLSSNQSIGDIYDEREVPAEIMMMLNNRVRCPNTRKIFTQRDNHQVFLVRMPERSN